jgi:PDDEXK-like domain of unknown function (DUF3799)
MINITPWDGKPISKPGLYSGVSMAAYHSGRLCVGPSVSSSGLRAIFTKSEAHFFDKSPLNPDRDPDADEMGEALILGRAVHHLLLGQPHFAREFVVCPSLTPDSKGKMQPRTLRFDSAREWVKARNADGLTVLTVEQMEKIKGMAFRLAREPLVKAGALNGLSEITMAWKDGETGIWCLSRPDVIPTDSGDFTDLKTIGRDVVSYGALVRAIGEYAYHQQAALCGEGWQVLTGQQMASFSFYFVESGRPHCARMVTLKDSDLLLGARQNRNAMRRFVKAMNTGHWPGPGGTQEAVQRIDLSDAKRFAIEGELKALGEPGGV